MSHSQGETPIEVSADNWFPENLEQIHSTVQGLLPEHCQQPVAVFDFDNTCIFRDIGQAVFRYQLFTLRYRLSPATFSSLLPREKQTLAGRPMGQVTATLVELYSQLYPLIKAEHYQQARELPSYPLFTTLLLWFVEQARKDPELGPRYVLPLLAKLLAGFTTVELDRLTSEVIAALGKEELTTRKVSATLAPPIGTISSSYKQGIQPFAEMRSLIRWLSDLGVDCYVISASTEWLVQTAVRLFDFPVPLAQIFGIRVELAPDDRLTVEEQAGYPITFREGKVAVIEEEIKKRPLMVAGDADTDFEMLTLAQVPLRLIINHNQEGLISTLYQAQDTLLQGIDISRGRFRPFRESVAS
ncbi:HAD family hydrolase [Desulfogranum mediterraneum]|uniref:haloacid dehalogenase-like hydrolase n=1 Tax=Desulfogranum mediterraneum TaxID=160661 RepID=UPI0003FAFE13|nr:haloacid dehalogenase-like hydrolase [Desulfogranum mediterraneum]